MRKVTKTIRGLSTRIQEWGSADSPTLFLLHGWMDCGASFQYVAQQLENEYHVVAPDLRGFGETEHAESYWFPDYFADLDVLLDEYSGEQPVNLIGHSMGGNIATLYAGIRPHRVSNLLILDALGLMPTQPKDAVAKYRQWIDEIVSNEPTKIYRDAEQLKSSIKAMNPTLSDNIVEDLVLLWGKSAGQQGQMQLKHDHKHRFANPVRYNFEEVLELWKEVTAKVGVVMAGKSWMYKKLEESGRIELAKSTLGISHEDYFLIEQSGHMLHLEQPQITADCIKQFFSTRR